MTDQPLSPAAQAVMNAAKSSLDWEAGYLPNAVAAAALEAAADELKMPDDLGLYSNAYWAGYTSSATKLLAIAAELKGSNG